jgi:AraC-like DNA-binding protein
LQSFNIHKNIDVHFKDDSTAITESNQKKITTIIQGKYALPQKAQLSGRIDKLTIVFKPLGLNHFFEKTIIEIAPKCSQIFTEWDNDNNYHQMLKKFYTTSNNKNRILLLEDYLLTQYRKFEDYEILEKIILLLTDFENEKSINSIIETTAYNTRTFNRFFLKHVGINPSSYRKIAKFRHSLTNRFIEKKFKNLTEIGYQSNFYDQSYFIKVYKELAGEAPRAFFKKIDKLANNKLVLKHIHSL